MRHPSRVATIMTALRTTSRTTISGFARFETCNDAPQLDFQPVPSVTQPRVVLLHRLLFPRREYVLQRLANRVDALVGIFFLRLVFRLARACPLGRVFLFVFADNLAVSW